MSQSNRYRVTSEDTVIDVHINKDSISIDNTPVSASLRQVEPNVYSLLIDNKSYDVVIKTNGEKSYQIDIEGKTYSVTIQNERDLLLDQFGVHQTSLTRELRIKAPMPGLVLDVLVEEGQSVEEGTGLLILEAMKMENEIRASLQGTIAKIHVAPGDAIGKNDILIEFQD